MHGPIPIQLWILKLWRNAKRRTTWPPNRTIRKTSGINRKMLRYIEYIYTLQTIAHDFSLSFMFDQCYLKCLISSYGLPSDDDKSSEETWFSQYAEHLDKDKVAVSIVESSLSKTYESKTYIFLVDRIWKRICQHARNYWSTLHVMRSRRHSTAFMTHSWRPMTTNEFGQILLDWE